MCITYMGQVEALAMSHTLHLHLKRIQHVHYYTDSRSENSAQIDFNVCSKV